MAPPGCSGSGESVRVLVGCDVKKINMDMGYISLTQWSEKGIFTALC